jgi:hypothetical protein
MTHSASITARYIQNSRKKLVFGIPPHCTPSHLLRLIRATRYLNAYYDAGMLDTAQGYNLQKECKKIKGLARAGAKVGVLHIVLRCS